MDFVRHSLTLFTKGGFVMYPLLACSIAVLAITIERYIYLRKAETDLDALLAVLPEKITCGDWAKAVELCAGASGAAAAIFAKGLKLQTADAETLKHTLEGMAAVTAAKLRARLEHLDTVVTLSPLLGLLGTVIGMINAFHVLTFKAGQPLAITGGVGEALVATAAGLCVAIMALVAHSYLRYRVNQIITDMEQAINYVLEYKARGEGLETA